MQETGLAPISYEYFAGHSLRVTLKRYQQWDELRAKKAAPRVIEALQGIEGKKTTPPFSPQLTPRKAPSILSELLADTSKNENLSIEKIGLSLENTGYCKKEKSPCDNLQGDRENSEFGATRFELDSKDPQKQGLFSIADIASTQFGTRLNYFEQILSFFDSLEPSEQESLLDALKERVKATK